MINTAQKILSLYFVLIFELKVKFPQRNRLIEETEMI